MMGTTIITYNGSTIAFTEETTPVAVSYNGNQIAAITDGETKTLICNGKCMAGDLVIGSKNLPCANKLMASDIAVSVQGSRGYYLTFTSLSTITIVLNGGYWNGTVQYSYDTENWSTYTSGTSVSGNNIHFRGIGNTRFATSTSTTSRFVINCSAGVYCIGNIETLLDYATVENGQHPQMGDYCFAHMFMYCASLITAPEFPATTLTRLCYYEMFYACRNLVTLPALPATTLAEKCYYEMFQQCAKLKLSTSSTGAYTTAYRIPTSGTGTTASNALYHMFTATGGTFKSTPTINTTYYTSNTVIG